ncbi:MAG: tRNA (adenosine(37)-N6)-dimethylallyltransferase MiaA [bacterium]|nr:tRNA (adenosine(37)-N6)-dimethylallyltransferase MiaA [bacterium]
MKKRVPIIVGPTAVGKTGLSLLFARRLEHVEIISADSRQVYRLMNIGTAKPTPQELSLVPHHFIDIKNPDEYYSAGKFGREARQKIDELFRDNIQPLVVGGSGLYIRALVDGFFEKQISDSLVKARLKQELNEKGSAFLHERLRAIDPISAERLHPNDGHRIVRALEVYDLADVPLSSLQQQESQQANFEPVFIGLNMEREKLYRIIEARVDRMIENGLVAEIEQLISLGYHSNLNAMQTVGYREVFDYFDSKYDFDEMIRLIKQRSRNYAKRQLTWFRKDTRIRWLSVDEFQDLNELCDEIMTTIILTSD